LISVSFKVKCIICQFFVDGISLNGGETNAAPKKAHILISVAFKNSGKVTFFINFYINRK